MEEDDIYFQTLQDLEQIYAVGVQYGDYWDLTLKEFIGQEMAKKYKTRRIVAQNKKTEERNASITAALKTRTQYLENQEKEIRERRTARMLRELDEYGVQQSQIYFRKERNRRAALLKRQLKVQANSAYNAPI